jgi:hypothetical protein
VTDDGYGLDDRYDGFWPQRSSQWDALSHFRHLAEPGSTWTATGLDPGEETVQWLWDTGITAVIADNPAVEAFPFDAEGASLLALLGVPLGELWYLDTLAAHCAAQRRYTGLLTAAPLNLPGGIGSPANGLALM